jgi:hypothetical protein
MMIEFDSAYVHMAPLDLRVISQIVIRKGPLCQFRWTGFCLELGLQLSSLLALAPAHLCLQKLLDDRPDPGEEYLTYAYRT